MSDSDMEEVAVKQFTESQLDDMEAALGKLERLVFEALSDPEDAEDRVVAQMLCEGLRKRLCEGWDTTTLQEKIPF